jgi:hypothetical protein
MEHIGKEITKGFLEAGSSYQVISERLRELYPSISHEFSYQRVKEYCTKYGLEKRKTDQEIIQSVVKAIAEVKYTNKMC